MRHQQVDDPWACGGCAGWVAERDDDARARSPTPAIGSPAEIIAHVVWLYFRFPLSLRMVEKMLAARDDEVRAVESVPQWARKFGQAFANRIRRRLSQAGDKWHFDEVVITIAGKK